MLTWKRYPHGPLTRYVKLLVAHAPGMPGTFSPPPTSKETASQRSRHASRHVRHARAVMHVGITNPRWRRKRSRHSRRMRNPQFYVSGKRPITGALWGDSVRSLVDYRNKEPVMRSHCDFVARPFDGVIMKTVQPLKLGMYKWFHPTS